MSKFEKAEKQNKEKFNPNKYNQIIANADAFFEASVRCDFIDSAKLKKYPLMVPNFTNRAFACELYLKATSYLFKQKILQKHNLYDLFLKLNKKVQKEIYNIWRTIDGQDMYDCEYTNSMFYDNLRANSDVFYRFRYSHEWARLSISLESSFRENQMYLHNLVRAIGSPPIYDGFLDQFAKSIKKYNDGLSILQLQEFYKEKKNE